MPWINVPAGICVSGRESYGHICKLSETLNLKIVLFFHLKSTWNQLFNTLLLHVSGPIMNDSPVHEMSFYFSWCHQSLLFFILLSYSDTFHHTVNSRWIKSIQIHQFTSVKWPIPFRDAQYISHHIGIGRYMFIFNVIVIGPIIKFGRYIKAIK